MLQDLSLFGETSKTCWELNAAFKILSNISRFYLIFAGKVP